MNQFLWHAPNETLQLTLDDLSRTDASDAFLARINHYVNWCLENDTEYQFLYVLNLGLHANNESEAPKLFSRVFHLTPIDGVIEIQLEPIAAYPASLPQLTLANLVTDHIPQGIAVINTQGETSADARIVFTNQTLASILGVEKSELINSTESDVFLLAEDSEKTSADDEQSIVKMIYAREAQEDVRLRLRMQSMTGRAFLADITRTIICDITGWRTHVFITLSDVTQMVSEQLESERQRQLNEQMQDLARMGWWELNLETQEIFWSRGSEFAKAHSLHTKPSLQELSAAIIPSDRSRISDIVSESIIKGVAARTEIRVIADGEKRWQRIQTQPGKMDGKRVKTVVGTSVDITDIVESEQLRLKQHQELAFYLDHLDSHSMLAKLDANQRITFCNENFVGALNKSALELKGVKFSDLLQQPEREYMITLEAGETWRGEVTTNDSAGVKLTLDLTMSSIFDEEGCIEEINVFGYDISNRKMSEKVAKGIAHLNQLLSPSDDLCREGLELLVEISGSRSGYIDAEGLEVHWPPNIGPVQSEKISKARLYFALQVGTQVPGALMLFDRPLGYDDVTRQVLQPLVDHIAKSEIRKRQLEAESLKEIEHKFILESLKIGSWRHDFGSGRWYFNEGLFDLLEYPFVEDGLVPQALWDQRVPFSEQLRLRESMKEMIRVDDSCEVTVMITLPEDRSGYIKIQGRLSRDAQGLPLRVIGIASDVTKDVILQRELENQKALASHQARLASIGELAAGVGHEINNPLTVIRGFLDIVGHQLTLDKPDVAEISDLVAKMDDSAIRIEKIVKGLRSLSHVDENSAETFHPTSILKETVGFVDEIYRRAGVDLQVDFDFPQSMMLMGHEGKLQQVLMNLLSNARDAVDGQVEKTIRVELKENNNTFLIKVRDNGSGVPAEIKEKIFDPFFTTKEIGKGTGIGLSMVFSIVQEFNGNILCSSAPEGGAEFLVSIPISKQGKSHWADVNAGATKRSVDPSTSLAGRILVVDDEDGVREFLVLMLTQLGLRVEAAVNGKDALQKVSSSEKFDLIITDLTMPEMGGLEFIKELQTSHSAQDDLTPVLLSTGFPDFSVDLDTYPAVIGLLAKPFDLLELRNVLDQLGLRRSA